MKPPAAAPCKSCPYRCDVPSGVWDREEYEKLPGYDGSTVEQLVAGATLRMAAGSGMIDAETLDAVFDYECPVPTFASGAEAAEHGMAEIDAPPQSAVKTIQRLARKLPKEEEHDGS